MADIPLHQRTELPPSRAGIAKPPFELAERPEVEFGQFLARFSGDIFDKLIATRAANEEAEFQGIVNTALADWEGFVKNNPGASFEVLQKQRDKMMTDIKAAGQNKSYTARARQNIENWYRKNVKLEDGKVITNEGLIYAKSQSAMIAIRSGQEAKRSDILLEKAIANFDKDAAADIIQKQSGKRYPAETVPLLIEQVNAEIDEGLKEQQAEQFGKVLIDAAIIKDEEGNPVLDEQGLPIYDWNNAKKIVTNPAILQAMGISLKDANAHLKNVMGQVKEQEMRRTVKSDKSVQSQLFETAMDIDVSDLSLAEYREMLDKAHFGEGPAGQKVYTFKDRTSDKPFIDDTDYEELSDKVLTEIAGILKSAHTRARDIIVAHPDDNAFANFLEASTKGLKPSVADLFKKTANEERQYQFAMVQKYDREMELWYAENKDKSGKEIYSHLESKKWEYFNITRDGIERMKKELPALARIEREQAAKTFDLPSDLTAEETMELIDFAEKVDEETRVELEKIVKTGDIELIKTALTRLRLSGTSD